MRYRTIKEAMELTGKSKTAITHLCRKYSNTKQVKRVNNKFEISEHLLNEKYSSELKKTKVVQKSELSELKPELQHNSDKYIKLMEQSFAKIESEKDKRINELNKTIQILESELTQKNKQIEAHFITLDKQNSIPQQTSTRPEPETNSVDIAPDGEAPPVSRNRTEIKEIVKRMREENNTFPYIANYLNENNYRNHSGGLFTSNAVNIIHTKLLK